MTASSNAMSPNRYLPETMGPGVAFLDYDNDGWMDLYIVNSGPCDFYSPPQPLRNALYRNNRDGTFTDITLKAGVTGNAYGMGVAVADYDGDGFPDLYVTQYPHSVLYHNNGDGSFQYSSFASGISELTLLHSGWGIHFFDYDNDGWLDIFVANGHVYPRMDLVMGGAPYRQPFLLFRNNRDRTFEDISQASGLNELPPQSRRGASFGDVNNVARWTSWSLTGSPATSR